jgi:hypothetical protein
MLIAAEYARANGSLNAQGEAAVARLVTHIQDMLAAGKGSSLGAPREVSLTRTLEKFDYDKKHKVHVYRMVTPQQDGGLELISVARDEPEKEKIRAAFARGFKALGWNYH